MNIDLSKAASTTHLSCGTTTAGHYVYIQQGLNSFVDEPFAKKIYDYLAEFSPMPPGEGWYLCAIKLSDFKSWHTKEFYRIHVEYEFRAKNKKYFEEIDIMPTDAAKVYQLFSEAVYLANLPNKT